MPQNAPVSLNEQVAFIQETEGRHLRRIRKIDGDARGDVGLG